MLKVEMTPNLLGFKLSGDYGDLDELYDAVWSLTVADDDFPEDKRPRGNFDEQTMSTRLLALNYEVRHAYQGSRNIELVDSGMNEWDAQPRGIPHVEKNVVFSVEILYPEAMYEALAINYLIQKRENALRGRETVWFPRDDYEKTILDQPICVARMYLSKLLAAVGEQASPGRFTRIRKGLTTGFHAVSGVYQQWVDILNNDYAGMTRKQREESLSTIVRDLVECHFHEQYRGLVSDVDGCAEAHGCTRADVSIPGLYEWDEQEW